MLLARFLASSVVFKRTLKGQLMRIQKWFYLLAMVLIAGFALAKMPFSNEVFGKAEGTLDYCARMDSASAEKYQKKKQELVKDIPESEVAAARNTEEYKAGYDWAGEELPKMSKEDVAHVCASSLEQQK
jgi:hypothetical protein